MERDTHLTMSGSVRVEGRCARRPMWPTLCGTWEDLWHTSYKDSGRIVTCDACILVHFSNTAESSVSSVHSVRPEK